MAMEQQMDFDFSKPEGKIVIPYPERKQKHWESDEEHKERINNLNKRVMGGGHTWGKPTKNDLAEVGNEVLAIEKGENIESSELHEPDIADKLTRHDPETQRRIDQMKKRRDIYD
jgi:hypothetical protein